LHKKANIHEIVYFLIHSFGILVKFFNFFVVFCSINNDCDDDDDDNNNGKRRGKQSGKERDDFSKEDCNK
jgi:hypothetical protein